MQPARKLHPGITALIVIVLVGIAATAIIVIRSNAETGTGTTTDTTTTQQTTNTETSTEDSATDTSTYKDGTYSATGSYSSPGGRESIDLTVTIKDGVIVSTSLKANATNGDAKDYQADFGSAYTDLVVGKNVDRVSLSRVAGSSLTSNGFNAALDQIKTDAKA